MCLLVFYKIGMVFYKTGFLFYWYYNSHLLTSIIQLKSKAVTNAQYSRSETIDLNHVSADITKDVLEENI